MRKIPYMVIVGKKEQQAKQVSVRGRGMQNLGNMGIESFLTLLGKELKNA
jgi:threonyl-tRNA synthetase